VIQRALLEVRKLGHYPDICVVLRATSPLRTNNDIDAAVRLLIENKAADSVVSVGPAVGVHPVRLKRILPDGRLEDAFEGEGMFPKRRQDFEPLYLRNGAIYAAKTSVIEGGGLWGKHCLAYVMPEERSVNINTDFQFKVAELVMLDRLNNEASPDRN
jgi:CMP-N-acetylneuraminic acid synthetase